MPDPIHQAADYIHDETAKLDAGLDYTCCLLMARHLHRLWSGETTPEETPVDIAQNARQRYHGNIPADNWDDECIPGN